VGEFRSKRQIRSRSELRLARVPVAHFHSTSPPHERELGFNKCDWFVTYEIVQQLLQLCCHCRIGRVLEELTDHNKSRSVTTDTVDALSQCDNHLLYIIQLFFYVHGVQSRRR
jgi:hypothetical protein